MTGWNLELNLGTSAAGFKISAGLIRRRCGGPPGAMRGNPSLACACRPPQTIRATRAKAFARQARKTLINQCVKKMLTGCATVSQGQAFIDQTTTYKRTGVKMQQYPVELNNVNYNATTQSFEALVAVHTPQGTHRYACAIDAPITMAYSDAASGLATQALRRHAGEPGLSSSLNLADAQARARAGKPKARRTLNIDPIAMLRRLAA
ncbi:hypothetical protein [Pseudosulfitobacter koreensis]|nr:hypothetical protein [Pseudosulfitobacter koreense]